MVAENIKKVLEGFFFPLQRCRKYNKQFSEFYFSSFSLYFVLYTFPFLVYFVKRFVTPLTEQYNLYL